MGTDTNMDMNTDEDKDMYTWHSLTDIFIYYSFF
jgi:hypothetical protein